jgi:Domain of unknown function (DUF4062)
MNKRYQVFVSSTYVDLQDERAEAIQALLELDCMPAGMELFPAANDQQWSWIKKIIDESDYYIVILAGRYGSIHQEKNISYTEMEYRYAIESGKPVLAFLHEDISQLPSGRCDNSQEARERLASFRKLCEQRLCKYWNGPSDLAAKLSRSLTQLTKHDPRPGWIRADSDASGSQLEVLKLKQENVALRETIQKLSAVAIDVTDLASGDEIFEVEYHCETQIAKIAKNGNRYWVNGDGFWHTLELTWDELFFGVIPALTTTTHESDVYGCINKIFLQQYDLDALKKESLKIVRARISERCGEQLRMQFSALGYISVRANDHKRLWEPTEKGLNQIIKLGALKKGEVRARQILIELTDAAMEEELTEDVNARSNSEPEPSVLDLQAAQGT